MHEKHREKVERVLDYLFEGVYQSFMKDIEGHNLIFDNDVFKDVYESRAFDIMHEIFFHRTTNKEDYLKLMKYIVVLYYMNVERSEQTED